MTTSAAKDMFLPPLTTLVTRLMLTTWSFRLSLFASIFFFVAIVSYPAFWLLEQERRSKETLELQPGLARCVCQSLDAAMIEVAATIEDHLLDALGLRTLGDELADLAGRGDVASGLLGFALLGERGGRGEGDTVGVVDQLGVDVIE